MNNVQEACRLVNLKEVILDEAKKISLNDGINQLNIRTVAKNSAISIGTVYNYYPSKSDLLLAVVEDFWGGALKDIDWRSLKSNNFYENIEKIYAVLNNYFRSFKENWLDQLALLKNHEKQTGRGKEDEYFKKMYGKIIILMDMDNKLKNYPWSESFSKDYMAEFIFQNMLMMLKKGIEEISFFIEVLKRILSNHNHN